MSGPIDWQSITRPLDVMDIHVPSNYLRRWVGYERSETGVVLACETAGGQAVNLRVDVVLPDVVRVRMGLEPFRLSGSDMLVEEDWPAPPFTLQAQENLLTLTTKRLRLEFPRFPWQMQAFVARDAEPVVPFFSQRIDDRAYGPGYEDMRHRAPDLTKIHDAVGFAPSTSLDAIIDAVAEDMRTRLDAENA